MRYQRHISGRGSVRRRALAVMTAGLLMFAGINYMVNPILKKMMRVMAPSQATVAAL